MQMVATVVCLCTYLRDSFEPEQSIANKVLFLKLAQGFGCVGYNECWTAVQPAGVLEQNMFCAIVHLAGLCHPCLDPLL